MACFVAGTAPCAAELRDRAIALDLGFSAKRQTCGLASTDKPEGELCCFAEAVKRVGHFCSVEQTAAPAALIIEAPLSCFFDDDEVGNPVHREFELQGCETRYWYVGAGATTCLAAVFFLRKLRQRLSASKAVITVFEGFGTFKKSRTSHAEDAKELLDKFLRGSVIAVEVPETVQAVSVLYLADCGTVSALPAVVGVEKNAGKNAVHSPYF